MRKLAKDTEIVAFIEVRLPDASPEEKLHASFEFWQFFDALWAIADRLVTKRENASVARDKFVTFATVGTSPNA